MKRFRPRYSTTQQSLEGLYDVVDTKDGTIISAEPRAWAEANEFADLRNKSVAREAADDALAAGGCWGWLLPKV